MTGSVRFHEVQRCSRYLLHTLAGIACVLTIAALFHAGTALAGWLMAFAVLLAAFAVAYTFRLVTEVRDGELCVRFPFLLPFVTIRLPLADVRTAEVRNYNAVLEYGGWGLRFGWKGWAFNARGNRGVQLVMASGRRILIGSQRPEELLRAIEAARPVPVRPDVQAPTLPLSKGRELVAQR